MMFQIPFCFVLLSAILQGQYVQGLGADKYFRAGHRPVLSKRAVSQSAKAVAVVENLLAKAKRMTMSRSTKYVSFRKNGDYATALADFNSANPVLHKINRNYLTIRGSNKNYPLWAVGNTRLILRQSGDMKSKGSPVLEIRPALDPIYTRIVYQKTEK